ncbi:hypothetical protein EV702DRAFT_1047327 [Suillus placidus]|uniref:Uncharacterized protein n=1 Tax=Suillus placidus TaxID=48579 RepID=A0A9P7CZV9_9AGAM|nr:hypothetical protein EV702DRAFT_1047327 [Suillus placidus]
MSATPASTSGTPNPENHYQPLKLSLATISCTLAMAASRVRACISQYQTEAANSVLSSDQVEYFKAGLKWEMNTFVTPVLQYSAAHNIVSVVPVPVAHILKLYPMLTWNTVPDDVFSSHLRAFADEACPGHASRIVSQYHGVEDDTLVLPEKLKNPLNAPPTGLRWMKSRMESLLEEQDEGIQDKMAELWVSNPRNPKVGTWVSGTRYSGQSIKVRVTNPELRTPNFGTRDSGVRDSIFRTKYQAPSYEPRTPDFGTRDSGVRDSIFRTKYQAPSYEPRTPNPELWSSGLRRPGLNIQVKVLNSELRAPNPKLRSSGLGTWDLELDTFMSAYIYSGQSIELRVTNPEPRTSELGTRASGTQYSGQYRAPSYEPQPQTSELRTRYSERSIEFRVTSPEPPLSTITGVGVL